MQGNTLGTTEIKIKTKSLPSKNSKPSGRERQVNTEYKIVFTFDNCGVRISPPKRKSQWSGGWAGN